MYGRLRSTTFNHASYSTAVILFIHIHVVFLISTGKCGGNEPEVFSLPYFDDALTVPVNVGGEEHIFLLDTGSTHNAVDTELRNFLGEPLQTAKVRGAKGRRVNGGVFHPPKAFLGKLAIEQNAPIICLDLSTPRSALGRNVKGVLGMPFFATHIVQVDFDQRQLRIFPSSTKPSDKWGKPVNVVYTESNLPVIEADFGDYKDEHCVIDLGFSNTASLRAEVFEYLLQTHSITPTAHVHTATIGEVSKSEKGLLSIFTLAANTNKRLSVLKSKHGLSRIGINYFRRFLVTFDLGQERIYLERGLRFDEPDDDDSIGVGILRQKRKTVVRAVVSDSVAERTGFQIDDELLTVAGQSIVDRPLSEIRWMLESARKNRDGWIVGICRNGEKYSLRVAADN